VEERGGTMHRCAVALATSGDLAAAYHAAIARGDVTALTEANATSLATMRSLFDREAQILSREGLAIDEEVYGKDGPVGTRRVANPRANPVFALLDRLGLTATDNRVTPKSAKEGETVDAISGFLGQVLANKRLAEGGA
jgi:hypothetical protein